MRGSDRDAFALDGEDAHGFLLGAVDAADVRQLLNAATVAVMKL